MAEIDIREISESFISEIYVLISQFLQDSPCVQTAQILKRELTNKCLITPRYDWRGRPHPKTFDDLESSYKRLPSDYLLKLLFSLSKRNDNSLEVRTLVPPNLPPLSRSKKKRGNALAILLQNEFGDQRRCSRNNILTALMPSIKFLRRTLGHLSNVYCLIFDRTGTLIVTGADDFLVKCWSSKDGRLLYTFRGAGSEIIDLSVNHNNRLLAAGSCDKIIRVWCLHTAFPIAVLNRHSGMISAINFCLYVHHSKFYYLSCTSGDGAVTFWRYFFNEHDVAEFEETPIRYHEKIRPGQAQMICASFSPGGIFFCVGSADHHIRVYKMNDPDGPTRVLEVEAHQDRVDSIQWCHKPELRFVSGSKDGTARIWTYSRKKWSPLILSMNEGGGESVRVTMVAWSLDDVFVLTAVSDQSIRLWNSFSGTLISSLVGHEDEIYVMEAHPLCSNILLSAAHDGLLILWNLQTSSSIFQYRNMVGETGHAAVYDAKWSPEGDTIACSDSHGHFFILGFGSPESNYDKLPPELFFHTDYRPLLRDLYHNVVDEQTQIPPHCLPPPFLVDSEGSPYPAPIQRFVRGRENCSEREALLPLASEPSFHEYDSDLLSEAQANAAMSAMYANTANESHHSLVLLKRETNEKSELKDFLSNTQLWGLHESNAFSKESEISEFDVSPSPVVLCKSIPKTKARALLRRRRELRNDAEEEDDDAEEEDDDAEEEELSENGNGTSDLSLEESDFSKDESTSSEMETDHSDWGSDHVVSTPGPSHKKRRKRTAAQKCKEIIQKYPAGDLSEEFVPSPWLSESIPRKTPYFPQIGDVLMYFRVGHERYCDLVRNRQTYDIKKKEQSFLKRRDIGDSLLIKVIGVKFEIRPPRLAVLKFIVLEKGEKERHEGNKKSRKKSGGGAEYFSLKYHDMNDVVDFLVLHQSYKNSKNWSSGDRIRCQIDDRWWKGTVQRVEDQNNFLSIYCHWDNGEKEFLSPWDLEALDSESENVPDGTIVTPEQLKSCLYHPLSEEWNDLDREDECHRISEALETIMQLAISEHFNYPVDQSKYPEYFYSVEYPMDLSLVKARVENYFYRRIESLDYDLSYIYKNALSFNQPKSDIVKNAKVIYKLSVEIARNPSITHRDVNRLYHEIAEAFHWSSDETEESPVSLSKSSNANSTSNSTTTHSKYSSSPSSSLNPKKWKHDCNVLLNEMMSLSSSEPFREPVSEIDFPDYHRHIVSPMDLSTIRESLLIGDYSTPLDFQKDVFLIFKNSKEYNTDSNSRVLAMTLDLEDWFENKIQELIVDWKTTLRRINRATKNSKDLIYCGKGKGKGKGKSNQRNIQQQRSTRLRRRPSSSSSSEKESRTETRKESSRDKKKPSVKSSLSESKTKTTTTNEAVSVSPSVSPSPSSPSPRSTHSKTKIKVPIETHENESELSRRQSLKKQSLGLVVEEETQKFEMENDESDISKRTKDLFPISSSSSSSSSFSLPSHESSSNYRHKGGKDKRISGRRSKPSLPYKDNKGEENDDKGEEENVPQNERVNDSEPFVSRSGRIVKRTYKHIETVSEPETKRPSKRKQKTKVPLSSSSSSSRSSGSSSSEDDLPLSSRRVGPKRKNDSSFKTSLPSSPEKDSPENLFQPPRRSRILAEKALKALSESSSEDSSVKMSRKTSSRVKSRRPLRFGDKERTRHLRVHSPPQKKRKKQSEESESDFTETEDSEEDSGDNFSMRATSIKSKRRSVKASKNETKKSQMTENESEEDEFLPRSKPLELGYKMSRRPPPRAAAVKPKKYRFNECSEEEEEENNDDDDDEESSTRHSSRLVH